MLSAVTTAKSSFVRVFAHRIPQRMQLINAGRAAVKRNMGGGGGGELTISKPHYYIGEIAGFLTWMWVFYRAKHDLPVLLGWRHPWEHAEDYWKVEERPVEGLVDLHSEWEQFLEKSSRPGEDDDEEEEEEQEEDDEEGDDDE